MRPIVVSLAVATLSFALAPPPASMEAVRRKIEGERLRPADFMRRTSVVKYDAASIQSAAPVVETFSSLEQLDAHGRSLRIRFDS